MELTAYLKTAIRAAQAAAHIHKSYAGQDLRIGTKSTYADLVTQVDTESEAKIRQIIAEAHPDHVVLGEEEGQSHEGRYRWIVDPLDGTLNYAHGFPFYCVSIALEIDGVIQVGVVLDSLRDELFTAIKGKGAMCNGAPIEVTHEAQLSKSMLATGFAYDPHVISDNIDVFKRVHGQCRSIRRPGAAALDLCYVACGRLDGFWELKIKPWDVAAGVLLVHEAGGTITDADGAPYQLGDTIMVATNGYVHGHLLHALALGTQTSPNTFA